MGTQAKIDAVRDLIRSGNMAQARQEVRNLAAGKLGRADRLRLAFRANQLFLYGTAVSLLHRIVRPRERALSNATDEEKAEYGRALLGLGAVTEAQQLLEEVDLRKLPRVARALAFVHFRKWDWKAALPLLAQLNANPDLSDHDHWQARYLLGIAIFHGEGRLEAGRKLFQSVADQTSRDHFQRMHWDALHLLAQTYFYERRWKEALAHLDRMDEIYPYAPGEMLPLTSRKWRTLVGMARDGALAKHLRQLEETRAGIEALGNWNEVRSCDFYRAWLTHDAALMVRMFYGSPHLGFRRKILKEFKISIDDIPERYTLGIGGDSGSGRRVTLDTITGENSAGPARLKPGQTLQRLLSALVEDIYVAPNVLRLHEALYPGELHNPSSSPVRVRQILKRFRTWLAEARLPLALVERHEIYYLESDRGIDFVLHRPPDPTAQAAGPGITPEEVRQRDAVEKLRARFGEEIFRARDVERLFGVSRSSALNLLRELGGAGAVAREGRGPGAGYRLA